jgi:two-component system sensor histidine kinase BaeS
VRRPAGLARQVTAVTCAVAALAVLLSGAVAAGVIRGSYDARARETLQQEAALFAELVARPDTAPTTTARRDLRRVLARTGVQVVRVPAAGSPTPAAGVPALPGDLVQAAQGGTAVSAVRTLAGARYLVEEQPASARGAVVLLQRASDARGVDRTVLRRFALALAMGLLAGVALGAGLARRLARPLVAAAGQARALAGGQRDVRLTPAGPREVTELAVDLNALAAALADSEGRQREFLLSVSHELRTPLTAVRGFAEALADGVTTGDDARAAGIVVGREAARLQRLVDDLLDLARLRADSFRLELADGDLTALLQDTAGAWRRRCADVGVPLLVDAPAGPVVVRTDAARVRQVLDGLAENALRLLPAGRPLVLALHAEPGAAVLAVRDGGPGLTDDDLDVAFSRGVLHERYREVRPAGSGLGLALVEGLVSRLGGTVTAGHAPEGGAAFTVRLPS